MKFGLLLFVLLTCVTHGFTQSMILYDPVSARTFSSEKYSAIKGTPFLYDKWIPGSATSARGTYNDMQLKLDAYENILYFSRDESTYEFQEKIISFTLLNSGDTLKFKMGLTGSNLKANQYAQLISEGKVSLYRSDIKSISEMSEINAGMVKTFISSTRYYIRKDDKLDLVKLNKSDIFEYLKDKEDKIKEFMDANKIGTKKESDFARILNFYNSLPPF